MKKEVVCCNWRDFKFVKRYNNLYDCKYYDTDYEFDGEDEYEIGICEA